MSENFYHTVFKHETILPYIPIGTHHAASVANSLAEHFDGLLMQGFRPSGLIRGCVAVKVTEYVCSFFEDTPPIFVISKRAKHSFSQLVCVDHVSHEKQEVCVIDIHAWKASLNAPLIDWIFKKVPWSYAIIHWHGEVSKVHSICPALSYYDPGSVRDSQRELKFAVDGKIRDFYIMDHGFFKILSEEECNAIQK